MYCKFGNFHEGFIFAKLRICEVLCQIKSSQYGEITLLFVNMAKSCPSHEYLMSQIYLLTLFAKIEFSRKFLNLQYYCSCNHLLMVIQV